MELDHLNMSCSRDADATHPRRNVSFRSLLACVFVGAAKSVRLQLMGLLLNPQEMLQVLLMMLQLVVGQTDVTHAGHPGSIRKEQLEAATWRTRRLLSD